MKRSLFWLLDQYPETGESVAAVHATAVDQAVQADNLGFHALWLAEHHFLTLGTAPNPAVLLAAIAQRTKHLRLGPATVVLPLRNPIQVAEDYALVDSLSDGRLNMGVGSGSQPAEYEPFGIDFEQRRTLYTENLAIIRERWMVAGRGEDGSHSINVTPVQLPSPPIYVATMNEETAFRIGLAGDSMLTLVPPSATGIAGPVARVREHSRGLKEAGLSNAGVESVVMMFAHVAETEATVKETVVPALGRLIFAMSGQRLSDPKSLYDQMRENNVGLFGTPEQVGQQLRHLTDLGIHHVAFVSRFGGMPKEQAAQSLQLLGRTT